MMSAGGCLESLSHQEISVQFMKKCDMTRRKYNMRELKAMTESYPNFEKLEFLPFHKLCIEKYEQLGLEFPLKDTPAMHPDTLKKLLVQL